MWATGTIWTDDGKVGYDYWIKYYPEGSRYGIENDGRISKLCIRRHGDNRDLVSYDREWDVPVRGNDGIRAVYEILLQKYN